MRTSILVCVILLLSPSGHAACPTADLSNDCYVGLADLAILANWWAGQTSMPLLYDMADQWLTAGHPGCPTADRTGDCYVGLADLAILANEWENEPNMAEFSVMASQWLTEGVPVNPENLVWISINDSGAGMKDEEGNPISHGGFTGEMSKYETTNAQYCEFLNAALASEDIFVADDMVHGANGLNGGADFVGEIYFETFVASSYSQIIYSEGIFSVCSRDGYSMADHPVVEVSWYGATAFCEYYGYRLPTEWEWQAVADYDGTFTYGCGATINQSKANYWDNDFANPLGLSSFPYTSPVDHYLSYGYQMNDMAGHLWEWTSTVSGSSRVIRGGSWVNSGLHCTVSYRLSNGPSGGGGDLGFRVCR